MGTVSDPTINYVPWHVAAQQVLGWNLEAAQAALVFVAGLGLPCEPLWLGAENVYVASVRWADLTLLLKCGGEFELYGVGRGDDYAPRIMRGEVRELSSGEALGAAEQAMIAAKHQEFS